MATQSNALIKSYAKIVTDPGGQVKQGHTERVLHVTMATNYREKFSYYTANFFCTEQTCMPALVKMFLKSDNLGGLMNTLRCIVDTYRIKEDL